MKKFTLQELKENDGQEGKPVYAAVNGKVYDLSRSAPWKDGKHMGQHSAGMDLTEALARAPHGEEVFENVPQVGTLEAPSPSKVQAPPP